LAEEGSDSLNSKEAQRFPSGIQFKFDWRDYQKRVLDELDHHLDDNHLHIIAPPGSGKTILGLEVVLRLNKSALVFAPTVSIRNQWIHRFTEMFLQMEKAPEWISRDIRNPKLLTVVTYQALHAACSGDDEDDEENGEEEEEEVGENGKVSSSRTQELLDSLKAQNIGTLVVDEAHHLKNAWWKSLMKVKNELDPTVVGLTATPPYDVSFTEWQRYIELNGPVDAEISVPELVVEGDLCPHQDYVYFCHPSNEESQEINKHREKIRTLFEELKSDRTLIEAIRKHPIIVRPLSNLEWIYSNLESYSASLIFLSATGREITPEQLEVIGDKKFTVPSLNYEWMEILLTFYLYKDPDNFSEYLEHQEKLINKLKRNGAMERRAVKFRQNRKLSSFLGSSISKLKSIGEIVQFEHAQMKQDLRMVVLSDYIRKEFLVDQAVNDLELKKIGVLPIFEQLRRNNDAGIRIGVLTGSLVIVPLAALPALDAVVQKMGLSDVSTKPLPFDGDYLIVNASEQLKHVIVHVITQIFEQGEIEVLVGTKSLLGEGWDAPSINSLVLASFVGSYVLSNQMRGRAIRTERKNLDKTGNIWHLVCVDPSEPSGGDDMELLRRRFKAFVGVSFRNDVNIENGIDRLNLPIALSTAEQLEEANRKMLLNAAQRDELKAEWRRALENGVNLIEEIKVPFDDERGYNAIKSMYYVKTIKYLIGMLGSSLGVYFYFAFQAMGRSARHLRSGSDLLYFLLVIALGGVLLFGRLAWKTFRLYVKYRDISKDVHQIAEALLETLVQNEVIHTDKSKLKVISEVDDLGVIYCHLEGGSTYEKSTFIKALQELVGMVDNPRYLIVRKSFFIQIFAQKDYHSVPEIIGGKKKLAQRFENNWRQFVGACELVYTRTVEGRKLLLKSRIKSLASQLENKTERVNRWK
jgi:superfamily II DNA or RNA helicase